MPEDNTSLAPSIPPVDPSIPALPNVSNAPAPVTASSNPAAQAAPPVDTPTPPEPTAPTSSSTVVDPTLPPAEPSVNPAPNIDNSIYTEVANKISDAKNVLIALSSDPTVDEMAAAIGLSLYLDKLGKRATAIYSGSTPNALQFLRPEETFEPSADTLQDFVIALNKDKADHLRYKLDGDFVKIYITPYKTRISENDLEFSYGDYNVDLVLALDVANGIDLDAALREHGRIMHDAIIINITTGNPGKFGEIEWSEKSSSSVSEMIANLLYKTSSDVKVAKEEATAFLTGIVAATNRFSNASTTPETMRIASKLMESGANQQLVSKNITPDVENQLFSTNIDTPPATEVQPPENTDPTKLNIEHGKKDSNLTSESSEGASTLDKHDNDTSSANSAPAPSAAEEGPTEDTSLLDDLKAAEVSLSQAGSEATTEPAKPPVKIDSSVETPSPSLEVQPETQSELQPELRSEDLQTMSGVPQVPELNPVQEPALPSVPEPEPAPQLQPPSTPEPGASEALSSTAESASPFSEPPSSAVEQNSTTSPDTDTASSEESSFIEQKPEKVIRPPEGLESSISEEGTSNGSNNKYGHMLEEALAGLNETAPAVAPVISTPPAENPAAMGAPTVPTNPEINGVPEINYMPMPGQEILPPPPAPPIDAGTPAAAGIPPMPSLDTLPDASTTTSPIQSPAASSQPTTPAPTTPNPAPDPSAFKIPGM